MRHIKMFETYSTNNPTEKEVYEAADEYFISINPNIMDEVGYNTYGHYANKRDNTNFNGSYLKLDDITNKSKDEVYSDLFIFLRNKGYAIDLYCPILSDKERRAMDLADRINFKQPSYRDGEYGRAILVKCNSGKTICFYFAPDGPKEWWFSSFSILRFDTSTESIYWTPTGKDDKLVILFWNSNEIVHGSFDIIYGEENEDSWDSAECDKASDSRGYVASIRLIDGDIDVEDVESIRGKI